MKYVSNPPVAGIIACSSPTESLVTKYSTFKFSVKDNTRCCIFGVVAEPGIAGRIGQNFLDITATPVKTNFQNSPKQKEFHMFKGDFNDMTFSSR